MKVFKVFGSSNLSFRFKFSVFCLAGLRTHGGGLFLISFFVFCDFSGKAKEEKNHVAVVQWVDLCLCASVAGKWAAKSPSWC